jgi:hypothetical protein
MTTLDLINYLFKSKVVPDAEEITIIVNTEYYFHLEITRKSLLRLANSDKNKRKTSMLPQCIFRLR